MTEKAIQGLGGISVDVSTQRIFYNSASNQLGGPAGLTQTFFNGTDKQLSDVTGVGAIYFNNEKLFYIKDQT